MSRLLVLSEAEMTEEIIKSITEAEEKASESKRLAEEQAAKTEHTVVKISSIEINFIQMDFIHFSS